MAVISFMIQAPGWDANLVPFGSSFIYSHFSTEPQWLSINLVVNLSYFYRKELVSSQFKLFFS